jgi:hypothetical protein
MKRHLQFEEEAFQNRTSNQNFVSDFPISSTTDHKPNDLNSCRNKYPYVVEWQVQEDS